MGPFEQMIPWSTQGVQGVYRFLKKTWRVITEAKLTDDTPDPETLKIMHQTLKKVTHDIETFRFNTAISQMMIMINHVQKLKLVPKQAMEILLTCLYPFAPHAAEEAWEMMGHDDHIMDREWPVHDESLIQEETFELVMTVNGKPRDKMEVSADIPEAEAIEKTLASEKVQRHLEGKRVAKTIYVPGKLVNVVVK